MKSRYYFIAILFSVLLFYSCTEETYEPVETCTIAENPGNATNPYNALYQQILDDYVDMGFPGISIAIETPEHGWWIGCSGMASIEDDIVLEPCHLFHSASVAKPYTGTMIMRLVEDGVIELDDPISEYLPEEMINRIANGDVATIRHCLSHSAGFTDSYYNVGRADVMNNSQIYSSIESRFEKHFYGKRAIAAPGEKFDYCNAGFDLLGMIIEKASGMRLGNYFEQEISGPLGLVDTYYKSSPGYPDINGLVNGYFEHYPGKLQNCSDIDKKLTAIGMGHLGVIATPYEFARFYQELIRGNILEPATLEVMLSEEIEDFKDVNYCLGIYHVIGDYEDFYGHSGMLYGILGVTRYFPDSDVTISIFTNLGGIFKSKNKESFFNMTGEIINVIFTGKRE